MSDHVKANIRRLMEARGMKAKGLSLAAGLGATYIRDILEDRSKDQRTDKLEAIARALGVTLADLRSPPGLSEPVAAPVHPANPVDHSDEFADFQEAVFRLLTEMNFPSDTRSVSRLSTKHWPDVAKLRGALPIADRIELTISEMRSKLQRGWDSFTR